MALRFRADIYRHIKLYNEYRGIDLYSVRDLWLFSLVRGRNLYSEVANNILIVRNGKFESKVPSLLTRVSVLINDPDTLLESVSSPTEAQKT